MKAVLFGSIGVLAETSELQRRAYNTAFARHDLDWHWNIATYCRLLATAGGKRRIRTLAGGALSSEQPGGRPPPRRRDDWRMISAHCASPPSSPSAPGPSGGPSVSVLRTAAASRRSGE